MSSRIRRTMVMGIDPGLSGAIALYCTETKTLHNAWDMPTYKADNGRSKIQLAHLAILIDSVCNLVKAVMIEDVHSLPRDGHVGAFSFGYAAGAAAATCTSFYLPTFFVSPQVWKGSMGLSSDKRASLTKARDLFKSHATLFNRAKDDGRAEAALIALFAANRMERQNAAG